MITGAHTVLYSRDPEADRRFLRETLGFRAVDAGGGYLIFALPPSEVAVHETEGAAAGGKHELYLTCDDVKAETARLGAKGVACGPISDEGWGLLTTIRLPGGGDLGIYEPRHALAHSK
jgi:catechol 2,3-dioxygenase-like lactoylglutathione lyase family enzyme